MAPPGLTKQACPRKNQGPTDSVLSQLMLILKPMSLLSHASTCGRAAVAAGTSERTGDTIIFQLLKQSSHLHRNFACHISAQRQFFWGRQDVLPVQKRVVRKFSHASNCTAVSRWTSQHTQDRNWRAQSWLDSI